MSGRREGSPGSGTEGGAPGGALSEADRHLIAEAWQAAAGAYAPYSGYAVGAAVLTADGRVFRGANVENASYGLTCCAERVALFKAVTEGAREIDAVAVVARGAFPFPCGACRQVLQELAPGARVLVSDGRRVETRMVGDLLPDPFVLTDE